jgi:hypothetical protein
MSSEANVRHGSQGPGHAGIYSDNNGTNKGGGGGAPEVRTNRYGGVMDKALAANISRSANRQGLPPGLLGARGSAPYRQRLFAGIPVSMQMSPAAMQQQVQHQANVNTVTPSAVPSYGMSQTA